MCKRRRRRGEVAITRTITQVEVCGLLDVDGVAGAAVGDTRGDVADGDGLEVGAAEAGVGVVELA